MKAAHYNDFFFLFFRNTGVLIRTLRGMLIIINLILTLSDFCLVEVHGFILFVFSVCVCVLWGPEVNVGYMALLLSTLRFEISHRA